MGCQGVLSYPMRTVATPRALCFRSTRPLIRRLTIAASSGTATAAPPRPRPPWHHLRASWKEWWSLGGPSVAPQEPLGRTLKQLSALVKEDSALLTGAITSMLLAAGAELTIPHFVTAAVFAAAQEGSSPAFVQSLTRLTVRSWLLALTLCLLSRQGPEQAAVVSRVEDESNAPGIIAGSTFLLSTHLSFLSRCDQIATAVFAVAAGLRGYLFSLVNMNLLQRLRYRAWRLQESVLGSRWKQPVLASCSTVEMLGVTPVRDPLTDCLENE